MTDLRPAAAYVVALANAVRDPASNRRIDPVTGKAFHRTKEQSADLDATIVTVAASERPLTLRRLHYALVSLGVQPNTLSDYRELSRRVVRLRRAGVIPKRTFVDNARETLQPYMWGSLADAIEELKDNWRRDPWQWSHDRCLVMVEKDALRNVLWPTCSGLGVPLGIARGRASESWLEEMADSINEEMKTYDGNIHVFYLGDWDPTGWANPDNIEKRLRGFLTDESRLDFQRIGLNPAQITALGLPTAMAAKQSDPNYAKWPGGNVAVEVDAVPVAELQRWVEDAINPFLAQTARDAATDAETVDLDMLDQFFVDAEAAEIDESAAAAMDDD